MHSGAHSGALSAALAFTWWGLFPLYFRIVTNVPAPEVLSHRVVWCAGFLAIVLAWRGQWAWLGQVARAPKILAAFTASAILIAINWVTYIWSVNNGHVLESSLGYFINPLVNVVLGTLFLGERPRRGQWVAVALAAAGVVWLTLQAGRLPWIALVLAGSFGAYGLLRKVAALGALEGLALETMLLTPLALAAFAWYASHGGASFPASSWVGNLWLIGLGPITAIPLLLFASGARKLTLTTLGLLQYIGPTIQFALGVWVFGEAAPWPRLIGFVFIWMALAVYSAEGWARSRRAAPRVAAPA